MIPIWKRCALSCYYHGTYPLRRHRARRASAAGRAPVIVLIFHRIADDDANEWTTPTATFRRAINWLERRFELISLVEAQKRIQAAVNRRPSVAITFDDGYAINCSEALPLLVQRGIPCTYFVTTQPVIEQSPFEHDRSMGNEFAPNTIEQLRKMVDAGIEIGAHTRSHADLGKLNDPDALFDELVAARDELEKAVGQPIRYFAFPFGRHENLSAAAFQLARQHGFTGVCSAYGGYNYPGDDAFHLQRCGVDGAMSRLRNWTTIDPLRNRYVARFRYELAAGAQASLGAEISA